MLRLMKSIVLVVISLLLIDMVTLCFYENSEPFSASFASVPMFIVTGSIYLHHSKKLYKILLSERANEFKDHFIMGSLGNWEMKVWKLAVITKDKFLIKVGVESFLLSFVLLLVPVNIIFLYYIVRILG